jgi:hypothetical protein
MPTSNLGVPFLVGNRTTFIPETKQPILSDLRFPRSTLLPADTMKLESCHLT